MKSFLIALAFTALSSITLAAESCKETRYCKSQLKCKIGAKWTCSSGRSSSPAWQGWGPGSSASDPNDPWEKERRRNKEEALKQLDNAIREEQERDRQRREEEVRKFCEKDSSHSFCR